jgi:hypothetical protein
VKNILAYRVSISKLCSMFISWVNMICLLQEKRLIFLGRPRHRWEDNIKMDVREIACDM